MVDYDPLRWAGNPPWEGLGFKIPENLTTEQILTATGLDWTVQKYPSFAKIGGVNQPLEISALVRSDNNVILDLVSPKWNPVQNQEAFDFFERFVTEGNMQMDTAGSLKNGQIVWALAKVRERFELFGGDRVDSYLLFTNPHQYGQSIDVRFTAIRNVNWTTLTLSLSQKINDYLRVSHRVPFDPERVKETLTQARSHLQRYREQAEFLGSRPYDNDTVQEFFQRIFPKTSNVKRNPSRNAILSSQLLDEQPGNHFSKGSWWSALNAVSFIVDHISGRISSEDYVDNRLSKAWYGSGRDLKIRAVELAIEYAKSA